MAFKNLDIDDKEKQIDHINGNRLDNNINNLRLVSNQQNSFNRTRARGYTWNKRNKNWNAQIMLNGKHIHLGCYTTEDEARKAYLNGKLLYHVIEADHAQLELNELENLEAEFQRVVFGT
jgi:predicted GNAT family N-acyltransferase